VPFDPNGAARKFRLNALGHRFQLLNAFRGKLGTSTFKVHVRRENLDRFSALKGGGIFPGRLKLIPELFILLAEFLHLPSRTAGENGEQKPSNDDTANGGTSTRGLGKQTGTTQGTKAITEEKTHR
jgi:hypothetical protein